MFAVNVSKFTEVEAVLPDWIGDPDPHEPVVLNSQSYVSAEPLAVQPMVAEEDVMFETTKPDGARQDAGV